MTFEGSTIAAGSCLNGSQIVRVSEGSVSVIDSGERRWVSLHEL
jgi:hypothetical protein